MNVFKNKRGLTLIELLIVVIILGALAAIAIPRMSQSADTAKSRACQTNRATMDTQVELYYAENSSWPALTTVTDDPNYFPDGAPACPSTGGTYQYYGSDHRVECTTHGH